MRLVNELALSLNGFLRWDKRRMDLFVKMLIALISTETVNLKRLACALLGQAKSDSSYRRLQRFFSSFRVDYNAIAKFIMLIFNFNKGKYYLILDRTNWQWGKKNINILFLCVAYKKIAIPVLWLVLNKKGNSSTRERIALVQRFVSMFGSNNISGVLGDREFVGKFWFGYLKNCNIPFYFRIKKDAITNNTRGKSVAVAWLFHNLSLHIPRLLNGKRKIYGHHLYVTGMRIDNDFLIVVTNIEPENYNPQSVIKIYGIRWEIETLFGCLKSKGFRFEDTHMTHRDRVKKLVSVLVVAFCWAHLIGEWRHLHEKTIPLKKHGRPQTSLFRYGLDWIKEALFRRGQKLRSLRCIFDKIISSRLVEPPPCAIQ